MADGQTARYAEIIAHAERHVMVVRRRRRLLFWAFGAASLSVGFLVGTVIALWLCRFDTAFGIVDGILAGGLVMMLLWPGLWVWAQSRGWWPW